MKIPVREISRLSGVPERTIRDWQAKGIVPKDPSTEAQAIQAIIQYYKDLADEARHKEIPGDPLYQEKTRLTAAQADKAELENKLREGQLIEAAQAEKEWVKLIANARARALAVPTRAAPQLAEMSDPNEIEACLKEYIYEMLAELAGYQPEEE